MASDETPGAAAQESARSIEDRIAQGNYQEALSLCTEAYAVPLCRMCMAFTGSQAESEMLVAEILLATSGAFPQYRAGGSFRAWLFGVARRICGRHLEMRSRRNEGQGLEPAGAQGAPGAQGAGTGSAQARRARAALAKLKPSEREAMVLRYEAGLSLQELSVACGVDEASARKRVSRALARLGSEIGKE